MHRLRQTREYARFTRQVALHRAFVIRLPAAPMNEQKTLLRRRIHIGWTQDEKLVLPRNTSPRVRDEHELRVLHRADGPGAQLAPAIACIRLRDVFHELA